MALCAVSLRLGSYSINPGHNGEVSSLTSCTFGPAKGIAKWPQHEMRGSQMRPVPIDFSSTVNALIQLYLKICFSPLKSANVLVILEDVTLSLWEDSHSMPSYTKAISPLVMFSMLPHGSRPSSPDTRVIPEL